MSEKDERWRQSGWYKMVLEAVEESKNGDDTRLGLVVHLLTEREIMRDMLFREGYMYSDILLGLAHALEAKASEGAM